MAFLNSQVHPSTSIFLNESNNQLVADQTSSINLKQYSPSKSLKYASGDQQFESHPHIDFDRAAHCNTIFYQHSSNTIYIPVYLNIQLKSIKSMDFQALTAQESLKIILNTYTKGLPEHLVQFIDQNICLQFKRDQKIFLSQNDISVVKSGYYLSKQEYQHMIHKSHREKFQVLYKKKKQKQDQIQRKLTKLKIKRSQSIDKTLPQKQAEEQIFLEKTLQKFINLPIKKPIVEGYTINQNQDKKKSNKSIISSIKQIQLKYLPKKKVESLKYIVDHLEKQVQNKKVTKDILVGTRYTLRGTKHAFIEPYVFLSPFETLNLVLSIKIPKLKYQNDAKKQLCYIKFNMMNHQRGQPQYLNKRIFVHPQACQFKYYNIATKRMAVEYTRNHISQTLMQLKKMPYSLKCLDVKRQQFSLPTIQDIKTMSISNAHFHIPIISNPWPSVTTHFVPLWLFCAINLGGFFLPPGLSDRLAILTTVTIATVSLIPVVRQKIPMSPILTIFQILAFLQLIIVITYLAQSLIIKDAPEQTYNDFQLNYHGIDDIYFQVALAVTLFIIIFPMIMFIVYQVSNRRGSNFLNPDQCLASDNEFINWTKNDQADVAFRNDQYLDDFIFQNENQEKFTEKISEILKKNYVEPGQLQFFKKILEMYVPKQSQERMIK